MARQFSLFDDNLEPVDPAGPPPAPPAPGAPEPVAPEAGGGEALRLEEAAPAPTDVVRAGLTAEEKAALLEELRRPALECRRCGLEQTRTHVVFGEGNPAAPLVLVGEGPGENEDATGRPFVGRAGKLLDQVLARCGMARSHVYICNTIKCRASSFENGRTLNRPPTPEEIQACRPWLEGQLEILRPLVIVCLGAPAASTLIHRGFRMTSERGRWFTTSPHAPWVTAAFHPAYVLRLHGPAYDAALETLVEDLNSARRKVIEVRRAQKEAAAGPPPRSLFD